VSARRLPDGRTATVDGRPRCRLAGCSLPAMVGSVDRLCDRHAYARVMRVRWDRWIGTRPSQRGPFPGDE